MKRTLSFLFALALLLTLFGCEKAGVTGNADGNIEITNDNSVYMQYSLFDGERTYPVDAQTPLRMKMTFKSVSGTLRVEVGKDGETPDFAGNITKDSESTVNLTTPGTYTIRLRGEKHTGSYNFEWEELTQDETASIPTAETATEAVTKASASTTTVIAAEAALVADYAVGNTPDFDDAAGGEYASIVSFSVDNTVHDFRYLQITPDVDESGNLLVSDSKTLYSQDTLTPDKPVYIRLEFQGALPGRAVSYVDGCGEAHIFALTMSGENGDVLLQPVG
ncbi:MAG: hypothetical protein ACI4I5_01675 [Acutalibacteraceae bacterium]